MTDLQLPYQAEYAKSGRAACKACKQKIDQGELRIAIMVQSAFYDGKQPNWHHEECLFKKKCPESISEIAHFNKLKHEDQKKIKDKIASMSSVVMPEEKGKKKGKGTKRANDSNKAVGKYVVEYAKSSRSTCKHCDIKICKDEVRVAKIEYDPKYGDSPQWHHVKCFAERKAELLFLAGGEDLPGFNSLKKEDQKLLKEAIKVSSADEVPIKKLKAEPKDEAEIKIEKELEKNIAKQNKLYHKNRSALSELSKSNLHELLEANSQEIPSGVDECMDRIADCMTFGALQPCPQCKRGQLVLDTFYYKCTGNISEWTKCTYTTKVPDKKLMVIPSALKSIPAFKKFKPKLVDRLFENEAPPTYINVKKEEPGTEKKIPLPPLKNLQFFLYGKFKAPKEEVKNRILKLGGLVTSKITETLAAVVSTDKDLQRMPPKMEEIKEADIEVVDETFLDVIDAENGSVGETLRLIKENNIADWGSDPTKRVPQDVIDGKSIAKSGSLYAKSKSGPTKLKIKGGTAVDPDSGLEDEAHVYINSKGVKYTVVLSKTDVVAGKNSYYKLQVLESDVRKKYWMFRSWGRIGTPIGGTKLDDCHSLDKAIRLFEDLYLEKTKNPWSEHHQFVKVPEAYFPIDMDYGEDDTQEAVEVNDKCSLPMPVQKLVTRIFDINMMKRTLLEFELDTEKMPLGKLSKKQIKAGYSVLSDLLKQLEKSQNNDNYILDATNRFYTLIPHNFGTDNPPLLNDAEVIRKKTEMLDNLLEIEIAYSLLKTDNDDKTSPIEAHYRKLKAEIAPLPKDSEEFKLIQEYVKTTHAETHSHYTLEVEEAFKVVREGEDKRYKPFKKLHNRRLLWHGSRVSNFAGILSQGLRIAPPEAPVTGYMFGKGIYFADMVSKSANYCYTNKNNPIGVMLLCEVALGDMQEYTQARCVSAPPDGKHSVWGVGRTRPDPARARPLPGGALVPLGPALPPDDRQTSLLYNEYIVYDVAQVNVKYLLEMKFNYKY
ncbi:poly [ADP-ribose] polymerase [Epargyreus clarus]|uniref:poly [ADP-ribose] polymerase n=1 Tax=Epargyreus clarus TaxID=520877 RepID=UPI003C2E8EB2